MGLLVTALTITLAVANHAMLRVLRSAMQHMQLLAGAFVLLSGVYLLYYFWVVDVNGESGRLDRAVLNFQNAGHQLAERQLAGRRRRAGGDRRGRHRVRRRPTAPLTGAFGRFDRA